MKKRKITNAMIESAWKKFNKRFHITKEQEQQFKRYLVLLREWNEKINITTITEVPNIINLHFADSLAITDFVELEGKTIVDIGSGGGFPGMPLKICHKNLKVFLLEVSHKKSQFLEAVISDLGLEDIMVWPNDWRTFLRKTEFQIDYFMARASLKTDELLRMFKPSCPYNDATLIYWASKTWRPTEKEIPFIIREETYKVNTRERRYIFLSKPK